MFDSEIWIIGCGIAAAVCLAVAASYGLRRRFMGLATRLKLGQSRHWLNIHFAASLLFLVLLGFHSRLQWPQGGLTFWLWILSLWTVATGILGLSLQRWIPRVLASGLSVEVHFDRIPALVNDIRVQAESIVKGSGAPLVDLYERHLALSLAEPQGRLIYFTDITGGIRSRLREVDYLRRFLGDEEADKLDRLESLLRTKLEIDAHYTLQRALRLWLVLHVPTSLVLAGLVVLHVLAVLYY